MNSEQIDVSRSGRVRKKSSKLIDFESPDEVEKTFKRLPKNLKAGTTSNVGRVVRSSNSIGTGTSGNISNDNENSDCMGDYEEDGDFATRSFYGSSDEEIDEMVADIVEGVESETFNNDSPNESKVRSSLYMSEKCFKRQILKDGKIITSNRTERKDKGKSRFTAYSLWAKEFRKTSKFSKSQDLDFSNASRRLGELWANVSNKEKNVWRRKAKTQASKAKARERQTGTNNTVITPSYAAFVNRATTRRTKLLAADSQKTPPLPLPSPNSGKSRGHNSQRSSTSTSAYTVHEANYDTPSNNSTRNSVNKDQQAVNIEPIDAAAHLKLLGESLSIIGERLKEHEGTIALSGSLSVLLDSILCSLGPLMCLTPFIPGLEKRPRLSANLASILDNIAYVMPGL